MSNLQEFNLIITKPQTQEYLLKVLGEKKSSFVNNLTALVANNNKLQECDPLSVMYAGIKATALDLPLDPNLGFAYVIPYKNNREGKTEAQFQIGYKGFVQLAIRSGQFKTINVAEVKEGELLDEDLVTGEIKFKRVADRNNFSTIGYVSFFRLTNGFEKMFYMTLEQVESHAKKYSQTYSSSKSFVREQSKWTTDFDAMAKKTVLKILLAKYAPLSVEMRDAIGSDQAVVERDGVKYVDAIEASQQDLTLAAPLSLTTEAEINAAFMRGQISKEEMEERILDITASTADAEQSSNGDLFPEK